jgi:hypothetical protein
MKNGPVSKSDAIPSSVPSIVCGIVNQNPIPPPDPGNWKYNIRTTFWADHTDNGGSLMPEGASYIITDAIALGQQDALGDLKWKNGLCGQVLEIDAGQGSYKAVVASVCNYGSSDCGVDLIRATWNKVTGNASPGVVTTKVRLTTDNPMSGGMQCFFRPFSGQWNAYYLSVGVFNTNGKIVSRAVLEGVNGVFQQMNSYFDFDSHGRDLFHSSSVVTFYFEDGSSNTFSLPNCRTPSGVHIF